MASKTRKPNHSGSTLDSLLREDGFLEEVEAVAIKRVRGFVDRTETLDEFLAKQGLLVEVEAKALKEIAADRKKARNRKRER